MTPPVVFDVGLHQGEDTEFYLKKGYSVVAFEADPDHVSLCRNKFAAELESGRLAIIEGALAPETYGDRIRFFQSSHSAWGTIEQSWAERNEKLGARAHEIEVARADFETAVRRHGCPVFVKVDVEGVDRFVLSELRRLGAVPNYISIESEKEDFDALVEEFLILREMGYTKFKLVQQATIPGSSLTCRKLDGDHVEHTFPHHASGDFGEGAPGPWLKSDEAIEGYRKIFRLYRLFGDRSMLRRLPGSERVLKKAEAVLGAPLPGWYDTHAALG